MGYMGWMGLIIVALSVGLLKAIYARRRRSPAEHATFSPLLDPGINGGWAALFVGAFLAIIGFFC